MALNDKEKANIIKAYTRGDPIEHIEYELGVPRSSIYYVLGQHGIRPSRPRGRSADARKQAERSAARVDRQLVQQNIELKQENKRLRRAATAAHAALDGVLGGR